MSLIVQFDVKGEVDAEGRRGADAKRQHVTNTELSLISRLRLSLVMAWQPW